MCGVTLSVNAQRVQQLGPSELGSEEAHVQSHEASVRALSVGHSWVSSASHHLRFGQKTVDEVDLGAAHHVDQSILRTNEKKHNLLAFSPIVLPLISFFWHLFAAQLVSVCNSPLAV